MSKNDAYGCSLTDDECIVRTFPARIEDAEKALRINAAKIEQTRVGTPSQKSTGWRRGKSPGSH